MLGRTNSWGRLALAGIAGAVMAAATTAQAQPTGCRADLDGDGVLTIFDFLQFQSLFDLGDPLADWDGDGTLNIFDFLAFQNDFLAGCEPPLCSDLQLIDEFEARYFPEIPLNEYPRIELPELPVQFALDSFFVQIQSPIDDDDPYQYGSDYSIFFCNDTGEWVVEINFPGIYHIFEDTATGPGIKAVLAGVEIEEFKKGDDAADTGTTRTFDIHEADIVISDKDSTWRQRWNYYESAGQNIVEVDDVADAIQEICDVDPKPLKKIIIANHGADGLISVGNGNHGDGFDGEKAIGKSATGAKLGDYMDFIDGLKDQGKVDSNTEICIIGCNVGDGAAGQQLVDCIKSDLGVKLVRAIKGSVTYAGRDGSRKPTQSGGTGWTDSR
ncbi:MAG: GC-type dockerin domain-anchored protein [Planctomycetota bacterium]